MLISQSASVIRAASEKHGVLVKNSGALVIGTVTAAVLGFVYWWLAARTFSPEVIGTASALISLTGFVGLIGECGIGTLLTGEIIQQPKRDHGLVSAAILACLSTSLAVGGISLVLSELVSGTLSMLNPRGLDNVWIFIGFGLTGISLMIDQAFVGMLQSGFRMLRQFLFSALKLSFVALVVIWTSDETAILISWSGSLLVSLILIELIMRRFGQTLIHPPDFKLLYMLKRKAAAHYMLDLGMQASTTIMPYLVAVLLSPASNAAFMVIWMIVSVAAIVPSALATVLFPVIRAEPALYRESMRLSLGLSLLFALVFGVFIYMYSLEIMTLFNPTYAQIGDSHLRFLGFGMIGSVVKFHACTAARVKDRMRQASLWFGLASMFELVCVTVGCRMGGLAGLSMGWVAAMLTEGVVLMLMTKPFGRIPMGSFQISPSPYIYTKHN